MKKLTSSIITYALLQLATQLTACGHKGSKGDEQHDAPPPTTEAAPQTVANPTDANPGSYDPALAAEYQQLPGAVVVGMRLDASGNPIPGSAEMRVADKAPADAASAAAAFASGKPVAESSDELGTSTASWSSWQHVADWSSYQPRRYCASRPGYAFTYGGGQSYVNQGYVYYFYQRPGCASSYCSGPVTEAVPVPVSTPVSYPGSYPGPGPGPGPGGIDYDGQLRGYLGQYQVQPLDAGAYLQGSQAMIALGERLFHDPILSAHNDVACGSCHIERFGTSNNYSLGPSGPVLGRRLSGRPGIDDLIPRNAPALFNLGHPSFVSMFWDGRVARGAQGFITPVGNDLPQGLNSVLAAQALFPLINSQEMGCGGGQGPRAQSVAPTEAWAGIVRRVVANNDYRRMLQDAYPTVQGAYSIAHVVNAIAAFEAWHWRSDQAPFDRYLAGDVSALTPVQKAGATYFYGKGRCASCHGGPLFTDHGYHAIAVPQFGPGAGDGPSGHDDWGFGRVSQQLGDRYKFRTPSLRNVTLSGPWGHDGAYRSLAEFVRHYRNPVAALNAWSPAEAVWPNGYAYQDGSLLGAWNDAASRARIAAANEFPGAPLSDEEVDAIVQFLGSLTDPRFAGNGGIVPPVTTP